jgi:hypothetical protein
MTHSSADARAVVAEILRVIREMRAGRMTADEGRSIMGTLRGRMSASEWTRLKFMAVANDR